jgi:taurine transport system ATP-binding protein
VFFITHSVEEALLMGIKRIVMSPRPGRITHLIDLNFLRQIVDGARTRGVKASPDFIKLREEVLSIIIAAIAYAFDMLMRFVERKVVPWKGKA